MRVHANAPLSVEGRRWLVDLMMGGLSIRGAAAAFWVASPTGGPSAA